MEAEQQAQGKAKGKHRDKILSAAYVRTATKPGRHPDGQGLYLLVEATGAKRWVQRLNVRGKRRDIGLGSASLVDLKDARETALANRKLARAGGDPLAIRNRAKTMPTFGTFADAWVEDFVANRRSEKHKAFYRLCAKTYCAPIRDKLVSDLTPDDIAKLLKPMWARAIGPRTRSLVERVLDAAKVKHSLTIENPARWKGNLKAILPPPPPKGRKHFAAVPYKTLPALMGRLQDIDGAAAAALEFTILHALRAGEVIGDMSHGIAPLTWGEVDLDGGFVTVAAERTKGVAGKQDAHTFPLTPRSLKILKAMHDVRWNDEPTCPVFQGMADGKGLNTNAMLNVLKTLAPKATVHGTARSSFKDWCANETDFADEISEEILSHHVGSDVRRSYRRDKALDKHREVLTAWATYLAGNVVQIADSEAA
ncbi:MAG: integrase arm-type DNA-binding domain-containing protein [Hyphomonadaceae bacterium]|nr:integrase arm-type DNA-binding domain-containing protein [Hyphomonadaceae bacterium]